MTRPFDKHLDSDELDRLLSLQRTGVSDSEQISEQSLREAQRHVESCQDCSRNLQMHRYVQSEILRMRAPTPSPPTPECIGDAEWLEVAAGLLPDAKTRDLMKHAAQCGHCGPLLKNAAEALVDEPTPSEEAWLASLRSARPEWRKNMAETLRSSAGAKDSSREKKKDGGWWQTLFSWPRPAFALVGIAVVVAGWLALRMSGTPSAEQLLAQAYTEHRTLEVRIPGAKFAPMRVERGTSGSSLDKPPSLLKAEALIGDSLRKHPNDPLWLQARARADLLNGNYDSAIKSLQRALETQPESPGLLTDLGSAYFVRAESADRPIAYGNAIESLGKALAKSPDEPVALFNRALACERMFLYTQALDDWEHYLRIDPQGEWAEEARRHLQSVKDKVNQHNRSMAEPLLTPAQIAKASADGESLRENINAQLEDYINLAVTDWLPKAYPASPGYDADIADSRAALRLVAAIASQEANDPWLKDVIELPSRLPFSEGVAELAQALSLSEAGDFVAAQRKSLQAAALFASTGNSAGELRAQYELVRNLHLAQDGNACLKAASPIEDRISGGHYKWLSVQLWLEKGTCYWIVGDLGNARESYRKALKAAGSTAFKVLYLRSLSHLSGINSELGDEALAWRQARGGLSNELPDQAALMQRYNLYFVLHKVAESSKQPYLDVTVWREAVAIGERTRDILLKAAAHSYLGRAAAAANMPDLALSELSIASREFASAPQSQATVTARAEADTREAEVDVGRGNEKAALNRLAVIEPDVTKANDNLLAFLYYRTLGEARFKAAAFHDAEMTLRAAVGLAELNLLSLRTEKERLEWSGEARAAYKTLLALKLHNGDPVDALEFWEWYRGASLRSGKETHARLVLSPGELKENPPDPRPTTVKDHLAGLTDASVISYAVFPDGIQLWLYDNRGVVSHWIPLKSGELSLTANRFRQLCSHPDSDLPQLLTTGRALYDLLIAPIEENLTLGRLLVVEADDDLNLIPFDALPDSNGHYLVERYPIVSSYGLYYGDSLRAAAQLSPTAPSLIVSVPRPANVDDWGLPTLVGAENEGRAVAANFQSPIVLTGRDADSISLLKHLRTARVFHFAGHAVASQNGGELLLTDIPLDSLTIERANLSQLELAVLSACETANGSEGTPVDANSLVRSFQRSGVSYVVASQWKLDSAAAATLMQVFYVEALRGKSVPQCLQLSKNRLRSSLGFSHPYYWAALSSFGKF